ncbi:MAG: hypothetical protein PHI35_06565 [Victivallaceae bacterium]|nr:hypothetical protein [Victivallaceae bacterium]
MKHLFTTAVAVAVIAAAGGCAFFSSGYRETREYDISVSADQAKPDKLAVPVRFGVFYNLSGAGLGFLMRSAGDRVTTDPYNRWLVSPEQMIEREFRKSIEGTSPDGRVRSYVKLSCSLLAFEFDAHGRMARLSMDFTASFFDDSVLIRTVSARRDFEAPVSEANDEKLPEALVAAMSRCTGEAAQFAAGLISKSLEKTAEQPPHKE